MAMCIQRLSSVRTWLAVFGVDMVHNVIKLRGILARTSQLRQLHRQQNGPNWTRSLLEAVTEVIVTPRRFGEQAHDCVKLRSCMPHKLSSRSEDALNSIDQPCERDLTPTREVASRQFLPHCASCPKVQSRSRLVLSSVFALVPTNKVTPNDDGGTYTDQSERVTSASHPQRDPTAATADPITTLLLDSQHVLFTIEYVVLAEYFELFCQLFYVCYMAGLSRLPAAKYHAELAELGGSGMGDMLAKNLLFVLLKLSAFVLLVATLWRVIDHDALRHLAFVLETRVVDVEATIIVWILVVMGFRSVHSGGSKCACGWSG
jgi:hypothetical protein